LSSAPWSPSIPSPTADPLRRAGCAISLSPTLRTCSGSRSHAPPCATPQAGWRTGSAGVSRERYVALLLAAAKLDPGAHQEEPLTESAKPSTEPGAVHYLTFSGWWLSIGNTL